MGWIGDLVAFYKSFEAAHYLRCFQRLIFACKLDVEYPDIFICDLSIFVGELSGAFVLRLIESSCPLTAVLTTCDLYISEVRIVFLVLIILVRIEKIQFVKERVQPIDGCF